jgi:hypothetical protein
MWNLRNWKTAWLLAIVLPISLLVTFRFTSTLNGPAEISETVTSKIVLWSITRPTSYRILNEVIENVYADAFVSINFSLIAGSYHENEPDYPSNGKDYIKVGTILGSDAHTGFIYSTKILFSRDIYATLRIPVPSDSIKLGNLKTEKIQAQSTGEQGVYVEAMRIGQPRNCTLEMWVFWVLLDENNVDHETKATLELALFDGIHYRKVVIPIQLKVLLR